MSESRLAECLKWVLKWEGSVYTNDPVDAGGPTRYGVIQERYQQYQRANGLPLRSVRHIEMPEVEAIYRRYYWDAVGCGDLPAPLDLAVFNIAVNSGPARAAKWLRALPGGLRAEPVAAARALCDRYEAFYYAIVASRESQRRFLRGWLNRLRDCREEIEEASPPAAPEPPAAWSLLLGDKAMGPAWANGADGGRAYFPARKFLQHLFPAEEVSAGLSVATGQIVWRGRVAPVAEVLRATGEGGGMVVWGRVRDMAAWMGLEADVDGPARTITLRRPSGGAKAEDKAEDPAGAPQTDV